MSLAHRRPGAPQALRIPAGPSTLPSRRLPPPRAGTPRLSTYGLEPSSLFVFEPSPLPSTPKEKPSKRRIENHEKPQPRILVGREPKWAGFYGSSSLWSAHLLGELE
jgi:hypothetical protein